MKYHVTVVFTRIVCNNRRFFLTGLDTFSNLLASIRCFGRSVLHNVIVIFIPIFASRLFIFFSFLRQCYISCTVPFIVCCEPHYLASLSSRLHDAPLSDARKDRNVNFLSWSLTKTGLEVTHRQPLSCGCEASGQVDLFNGGSGNQRKSRSFFFLGDRQVGT